jgi:hypothetical protein
MSQINVNTIRNRTGGAPNLDKGAVVTGIVTATTGQFAGDVTVGGVLTYEDVTNVDSVGLVTAKSGIKVGNPVSPGIGATIDPSGNAVFAGIVTAGIMSATTLYGDGSLLTGIDATSIQTGNTSVQTVDTGSDGHVKMTTEGGERVRVGPAGQIGLSGANYGSSGQLLTSGGSGAAPTWTTVSSAPEVTGTANGAIAAGKPVIANADGSISQARYDYTVLSPYQYTDYDQGISGYDMSWTKVGYDSTNNQLLYFWKSTQQSNRGNLTIGTPTGATTGTNVTLGSNQELVTQVGDTGDIVWSKTSALGVAIYSYGSGIFVKAFTSDGTTITKGTELNICGNGSSLYPTISWDESSDKFLVVVGDNADNSNYAEAYVVSHSGTTLTKGSAVTVKLSQAKHADLAYDSDNNRHLLTYSHQQDSDKLCGRIITVSGTVPTVHAETKLTSVTSLYNTRATYIPGSGKFVTVYGRNSSFGYARVVSVDGSNAITFGTESSAIPGGMSGSNYGNMELATTYDAGLGKVVVGYVDYTNMAASYVVVTTDTSANTITSFSSQAYVRGNSGNSQSRDVSVVYAPHWQMNAFTARRGTGGVNTVYWNLTTTSRTTNITGENYLGLANASYTNGQTASIRVTGATQDSQSGLTPGQNYFVQNDGTLGLTAASPKVYAGTAVSSTKLLVGKESPSSTPEWTRIAGGSIRDLNSQTYDVFTDFASHTDKKFWQIRFYFESTSSSPSNFALRVKVGGSWKTSNYAVQTWMAFGSSKDAYHSASSSYIWVPYAGKEMLGTWDFYDPNRTDRRVMFSYNGNNIEHNWTNGGGNDMRHVRTMGGLRDAAAAIQGVQFVLDAGGFAKLDYGVFASEGWF